ncbi:MAG: hypothetical protein ACRCZD_15565 [Phycicoccus sp.]
MTSGTMQHHRTRGRARANGVAALVAVLTVSCLVVAVTRPALVTEDLRRAIEDAGAVAPVVFTLLCAAAAPLHLSKLFVLIAPLIWTQPTAAALALLGCGIGCAATAAVLARAGADGIRRHTESGPRWLAGLMSQADRRPMRVGILLRLVLGTGAAVEALLVAGRYGIVGYTVVTMSGLLVWIGSAQGATAVLASLVSSSPWFLLLLLVPPLLLATVVAIRARVRRRAAR